MAIIRDVNFFFYHGPLRQLFKGTRREVARRSLDEQNFPGLVLGPRPREDGLIRPWACLIRPSDPKDVPIFGRDGGIEKVMYGSIVDAPEGSRDRNILTAFRDPPGTVYVTVYTAFRAKEGESIDNAVMRIAAEHGKVWPHGAFSFHRRVSNDATLVESAEEADLGSVEAELKTAKAGRFSRLLGQPLSLFLEYRMPPGSVLIVGHPEGYANRLVNDSDAFKDVDASGYRPLFDELHAAHEEVRKARRAERAQQKKSA